MTRSLLRAVFAAVAVAACVLSAGASAAPKLTLTSAAFAAGGRIPVQYTCDGRNAIVPLRWSGAPAGTRSFALKVDDPDAPIGTFLHRLAWGIPGAATSLPGRAPREGANGTGQPGWIGPCPPSGTHRYVFRLYALRSALPLPAGADLDAFDAALKGRVLATARLVGRYSRQ